jgi:XisH protein
VTNPDRPFAVLTRPLQKPDLRSLLAQVAQPSAASSPLSSAALRATRQWAIAAFLLPPVDVMPARDLYHQSVKTALIRDGWTITHDPFRIRLARGKNLFVDLGAERLIAADRGSEKIAVEIKSFTRASDMKDLEEALGQYVLYERLLVRYAADRRLYLAVTEEVRKSVFEEEAGQVLLEDEVLRLVTFDPEQEVIVQWIRY